MISLFANCKGTIPNDQVSLEQVVQLIKNDSRLHEATTKLKSIAGDSSLDKSQRKGKINQFKERLPAVTFSGEFSTRNSKSLTKHSGYIIMDIDDIPMDKIESTKEQIIEKMDPVLLFISPSQGGLKALHKIELNYKTDVYAQHLNHFNQLVSVYKERLNIKIDESGKNVDRLCFLVGDDQIYYNPNSVTIKLIEDVDLNDDSKKTKPDETKHPIKADKNYSDDYYKVVIIKSLIKFLQANDLSITREHHDWIVVGFALKNELGEQGREYYHQLSIQDHDKYDRVKVDEQFDRGNTNAIKKVGMPRLLSLARDVGFVMDKSIREVAKKYFQQKSAEGILQKAGFSFRFNALTKCIEFDFNGSGFAELDDKTLNEIYYQKLHRMLTLNDTQVMLSAIAEPYDPVYEFINSLPKVDPEIDFIKQLAGTISSTNDDVTHQALKVWLVGFIRCLIEDSFANELIPILIGGQGVGKTRWVLRLIPPVWNKYASSKNLDPKDKDDLKLLCNNFWIVMDELSTILTHKASTEAFKAMVTTRKHTIRLPYDRIESNMLRKASIIGTSNEDQYLRDLTGNRRFLSIKILDVNPDHNIDMMKVYSQAFNLYKQLGDKAGIVDFDLQQQFEEHNQDFEVTNPYIEYVQNFFVPAHPKSPKVDMVSTTNMIEYINDNKRSEVIPPNAASTIGKILRKIGFAEPEKRRINKINGRWYPVFTKKFFNDNKDKMEIVDGKYFYSEKGDSSTTNIVDPKPDKPDDPELGDILDMI